MRTSIERRDSLKLALNKIQDWCFRRGVAGCRGRRADIYLHGGDVDGLRHPTTTKDRPSGSLLARKATLYTHSLTYFRHK